ncbi:hypothetical protein QQP08_001866 [Theobroma cacao]|nr:hypothetical protein QQP08_001866 [Theobroma cacao]
MALTRLIFSTNSKKKFGTNSKFNVGKWILGISSPENKPRQTTHMKVQDYSNGMNLLLSLKQPISCQGKNERSTCIVGPALDNWKLGMSD